MATPSLTTHALDGALGPIAVDMRAQQRASPRPAVLILHGFKGFKDWGMFPPFAERLARSGVSVVSCNVSGSGVEGERCVHPERFAKNTYTNELHDILTVVEAMHDGRLGVAPPPRLGLVGHSRGGGLAVLAADRDARVSSLVTWSAISTVRRWDDTVMADWRRTGRQLMRNARTGEVLQMDLEVLDDALANADGTLDIRAAAARLTMPWLLIHGTSDEAVPIAEAEALLAASGGRAELLRLEGAGHTFGARHPWQGSTPDFDRTMEATIRWLARTL